MVVRGGPFYSSGDWSNKVHERSPNILYRDSPPCFLILKISKEEVPPFMVGDLPTFPPLARVEAATD
jgi:hypothetical protein